MLNVDLSTITAATDIALGHGDPPQLITDLNFQSSRDEDAEARVLLYSAALYYRYRVPVHSVVVLLRPAAGRPGLAGKLRYQARKRRGKMEFSYEIIRLWQRPVRGILESGLGTLPLAPLCRMPAGVSLEQALPGIIRRIDERLRPEASPEDAGKLMSAAFVLTGLRLPRAITDQLFAGVTIMRESSTYQGLLQDGRLEEARKFLLRQGRIRFGPPDEATATVVNGITDLERLERMGDRLVTASTWQEVLETP